MGLETAKNMWASTPDVLSRMSIHSSKNDSTN